MLIKSNQLPQIKADIFEDMDEWLRLLNTNKDHTLSCISDDLESNYRMLAVVCWLNDGNRDAFFKNMYLAAAVRLRLLKCVRAGMTCEQGFLFATNDRSIYEALVCGQTDVLTLLAKDKFTAEADRRFDNPYYFFFTIGLRFTILSLKEKAGGIFKHFDEERGSNLEGYSLIAKGILSADNKTFNDGLALSLEKRRQQIGNDEEGNVGEQWLSVECLALARLGIMNGLQITFKDDLIPAELLGPITVTFPDPETVFPPIPKTFVHMPEEM